MLRCHIVCKLQQLGSAGVTKGSLQRLAGCGIPRQGKPSGPQGRCWQITAGTPGTDHPQMPGPRLTAPCCRRCRCTQGMQAKSSEVRIRWPHRSRQHSPFRAPVRAALPAAPSERLENKVCHVLPRDAAAHGHILCTMTRRPQHASRGSQTAFHNPLVQESCILPVSTPVPVAGSFFRPPGRTMTNDSLSLAACTQRAGPPRTCILLGRSFL